MEQLEIPRDAYERVGGGVSAVTAAGEITRLRAAGYGPTAIARSLNARGLPTPSGRGRWWESTVRRSDPFTRARWAAYMRRYRSG